MIIRFSTPRTFLCADGVSQLDSRSIAPEVIIGRDLCRFVAIDLSHVPGAQRRQALEHQIEASSPWARTAHHVVWCDGFAQVWFWDEARVESILAEAGLSTLTQLRLRGAIRLPETIFRPRPSHDGLVGQACLNGFELLRWHGGVLRASRWYAAPPGNAEVGWFLRSQGCESDALVEQSPAQHCLPSPWPGSRPPPWRWLQLHQRSALYALGFCVVLIASLQITAGVRWWTLENSYRAHAAELQGSTQQLLDARGQARRAASRYGQMLPLFEMPGALAAQWLVTSRMPTGLDYKVIVWERVERSVEMVIEADVSDTLGIVRALAGPGIGGVTVEPWRKAGHYSVRLQLIGPIASAAREEIDVTQ